MPAYLATVGVLLVLVAPPKDAHAQTVSLAGLLTQQGQKQCLEKWEVKWVDPHWQVGFTRLTGTAGNLQRLDGKPVLVTGTVDADFTPPLVKHLGECPIPQMRSDWVESRSGMRIRRTGGSGISRLKQVQVRELTELKVRLDGDEVVVEFANPIDHMMEKLTIRLHYEGCYGKPGTTSSQKLFETIVPKKVVTARFPKLSIAKTNRRGRSVHRAASVHLFASDDHVTWDMDLPLHKVGAGVRCPDRK